ncbi:MAG TPA: PAS domain-containing protein, partial [Opitutales bacterium]|nr:PAS domain-containing protein [Opitutales bacterium]
MPSHPVFGDDPDLADALESLADAMPVHAMILDADRRIVFANQRLRALLGDERFETIAKLRPGEALRCVHSLENPGGCGCSDHCGVCGAFMAIRAAMQGRRAVQECRMKTADGSSHDFRVWANPVVLGGRKLTAFSILDISDEKRREKLEHTFFHDMMNMASGIYGMMEVIDMSRDDSEECTRHLELAKKCALHLTGEIRAAMALSRAELNSLNTTPNSFMVSALVDSVAEFFRIHSTTGAIRLDVTLEGGDLEIVSDESLLVRV